MTFVHTADWQLGKPFGRFDAEKGAVLRKARLDAIDCIASAARNAGAGHVLVAGDVFDGELAGSEVVRPALARLAVHSGLVWHLLPGNHDPARPGGLWDAVKGLSLAPNVRILDRAEPSEIEPGVVLLPAPLAARKQTTDPTAWMDRAETPPGHLRIGLAHGSIRGFGSLGEAAVPIDPGRPDTARLDYLALGDWHGTKEIGPRLWYSGTPEPDSFADNGAGHVLVVTIEAAGHPPKVERVATASFRWLDRRARLETAADLAVLEAEVRALGQGSASHLVDLRLTGRISLSEAAGIERRLLDLESRLFHLSVDRSALVATADTRDLTMLGSGALARIGARLDEKGRTGDEAEARLSRRALARLVAITAALGAEEAP
jgi:DNA repair exonuclease SbcCD nuclease subunit